MSDELKTRLLVVDDEQSIRRLCMTIGTALGFLLHGSGKRRGRHCRVLEADSPDLVLTDLKLPNAVGRRRC